MPGGSLSAFCAMRVSPEYDNNATYLVPQRPIVRKNNALRWVDQSKGFGLGRVPMSQDRRDHLLPGTHRRERNPSRMRGLVR